MKNYFLNLFKDTTTAQRILFCVILLVASFLRLSTYFELSYYNDELSALVRVQETEFSQLIAYGDKVNDEHPMLIQGFLYVWTTIVGFKEWIVKLPFLILGFATLILLFDLTKQWTKSASAGLLVMAFFSVLQLHVLYSHSIRMYISGLFFMLLFVKHLWSWLETDEPNKNKNYFISVSMFALIGYNHHIGMLGAVLMYFCGFIFCKKSHLKNFLLLPLFSFLLYLPILPMTYEQVFGYVGLSWMGQPEPGIFSRFTHYLFHFEWYYAALVLIPVLIGLLSKKIPSKKTLVSTLPFVISFILLVAYTRLVAPIYQNHLLFFTLPFIFICLFSITANLLGQKLTLVYASVILLIGSYTLISGRKHLELFPKQPYGELHKEISSYLDTRKSGDSLLVIHNLNTRYAHFYFKEFNEQPVRFLELSDSLGTKKELNPTLSPAELSSFKNIILLNTPLYYLNFLSKNYHQSKPTWIGFAQTKHYLQRKEEDEKSSLQKNSSYSWENNKPENELDTVSLLTEEFGLKLELDHIHSDGEITLTFDAKNNDDFLFVLHSKDKETNENTSYKTKKVIPSSGYRRAETSFLLTKTDSSKISTTLYLWNNNLANIYLTNIKVKISSDAVKQIDKTKTPYLPEVKMEYNSHLDYAFSIEVEQENLEDKSFIYGTVICKDTVYSFHASDLKHFIKTGNKRSVGMQIIRLGYKPSINGCQVKFGVFNEGLGRVKYKNPLIKTYQRNPYYYGILEKLD